MRHSALLAAAMCGTAPGLCSMAKDGDADPATGKAQDTAGGSGKHASENTDKDASRAAGIGFDVNGTLRLGDRYSIGVRGDNLLITQGRSGRQVTVSDHKLAALLENEYFVDKHD